MADDAPGAKKNRQDADPPPRRVSRHVQPLGPRVLVRIMKSRNRLESGLYLPEGAKDAHVEALLGEVVEVARTQPRTQAQLGSLDDDVDDDDDEPDLGANVSGIPLAAKILFGKDKGIAIPWDESLRLVEVRHVLAIVEEIPEERMQ
jgi:co-chaperonin GroES (HSP10)